jgi:PncC family amidohydrolase
MGTLDEDILEVIVGELLKRRRMTLAVYYEGSITAYSYYVQELVLHVRHDTLYLYGAVSEQTAREMALGAQRTFRADIGLAVTGIAGPGGGTPEKPVGLVYVALAAPDGEWVERCTWDGNRLENKEHSAEAALDLLRRYLEGRL